MEETVDKVNKILSQDLVKEFNRKQDNTGIVYLSRIPPLMSPHELRSLLAPFGTIGRIYLTPIDGGTEKKRRKSIKHGGNTHRIGRFIDGWVEFESKRDAKTAVLALNGHPIGGKKSYRFHDDLWTLKYLGRDFKWSHLTEQISYENAIREQKMRTELALVRRENSEYLKQVEKARVVEKILDKQVRSNKIAVERPQVSTRETMQNIKKKFRQRKPVNVDLLPS